MQLVYMSQRYDLLETELELWGYEIVRDGQFSSWDDQVALAPLTGSVRLRGEREQGGLHITFTIAELWVLGNVAGRLQVQGVSLDRYHYHGQAGSQRIRWCLDEARHPENPSHVHRFDHSDGEQPDSCATITVETALQTFEQRIFEMTQRGP